MGVPTLGCGCEVCAAAKLPGNPNRRTRPSLLIQYNNRNVLIDTGPDFHAQAIRENVQSVDAVLYTHGHADHVLGMDDLRPLSFGKSDGLPLYADDDTATVLERIFEYTFRKVDRYPTSARVVMHRLSIEAGTRINLFDASFIRIPVTHGKTTISGYRFGNAAYLTDLSDLPTESIPLLAGLDILIIDALRREPHPTHSHLEKSIELVRRLAPQRAYFTHISHDLEHDAVNAELPSHMRLAHDGLKLGFDIAPHDEFSA